MGTKLGMPFLGKLSSCHNYLDITFSPLYDSPFGLVVLIMVANGIGHLWSTKAPTSFPIRYYGLEVASLS
jgi:hypothetical protein